MSFDFFNRLFNKLDRENKLNWLNDKTYLKIAYLCKFHKPLNLKNPKTFNEKLQWLKLYDHNPLYNSLVDKYKVKEWVAEKIGDEYVIPLLGVWDNADDIAFDKLPNQFVLKCTHNSGGLCVCKDKTLIDKQQVKNSLSKILRKNYYYFGREWPYKDIKPRIIAEKYMVDESGYELKDYKFFCFNGKVQFMFVAKDRTLKKEVTFDFFDRDFNHLPIKQGHPNTIDEIEKPKNYEKMINLAEELSKDIPQVRVDLYNCNGKIYFGEMTFYHFSGMMPFEPNEWDKKFGELIDLTKAYYYKKN